MYGEGGFIYMYLIYGMYWMLNVVCGPADLPQAVLLRGIREADGPGKLTRLLELDRGFYGEDLVSSQRIWIEESGATPEYSSAPRVGIDYAAEPWKSKPWRFLMIL
jgi:DNA-3-methyladenine glycosylase